MYNPMQNQLSSLLQKEMDRRDFLKHIGIGLIALTGVATLLKTLNGFSAPKARTTGYGASVYGGNRPVSKASH